MDIHIYIYTYIYIYNPYVYVYIYIISQHAPCKAVKCASMQHGTSMRLPITNSSSSSYHMFLRSYSTFSVYTHKQIHKNASTYAAISHLHIGRRLQTFCISKMR